MPGRCSGLDGRDLEGGEAPGRAHILMETNANSFNLPFGHKSKAIPTQSATLRQSCLN